MRENTKDLGKLHTRSLSRLYIVQALYQMDIAGTPINEVIADFGPHHWSDEESDTQTGVYDTVFFESVLRGVIHEQQYLDPVIDRYLAEGWRLTRIDSILRAILRAGTYELCQRSDIPFRVILDEYVELARDFFNSGEVGVVNGVLDTIARIHRPLELAC